MIELFYTEPKIGLFLFVLFVLFSIFLYSFLFPDSFILSSIVAFIIFKFGSFYGVMPLIVYIVFSGCLFYHGFKLEKIEKKNYKSSVKTKTKSKLNYFFVTPVFLFVLMGFIQVLIPNNIEPSVQELNSYTESR